MKLITVLAMAVALANAIPFSAPKLDSRDCSSNNCMRAIRGAPEDVANMFCSTALGKSPATDVITVTATATVTAYTTVVSTATTHVVTGTVTVAPDAAKILKRKTTAYSEYASKFSSQCSYQADKITSACGCYLASATTSTVTVYETVSATFTQTTVTSTSLTTLVVEDVATVTACSPIPTNVVQNGDFEQNIDASPWEVVAASPRASHDIVTDAENGDATRVFHSNLPNDWSTDDPYTGQILQQSISTCPGVEYKLQWDIRCSGDPSMSYAYAYMDGNVITTINGIPGDHYGTYEVTFTATGETTMIGLGALEVWYQSGDFYFDNVSVVPAPVVS